MYNIESCSLCRRHKTSAFFEDLLDNLQIPNCQPDPDSLRSTNDPFSPDFGGNTPSPPPGSGAGSTDDQDSENEYVMVPGDSGVSCAQACEDQGQCLIHVGVLFWFTRGH